MTFIRDHGLHEVGLFRLPGRASLVQELQEAFDSGERPSFDGCDELISGHMTFKVRRE